MNTIIIGLLLIELALCVFFGLHTLTRCKSTKRTYFIFSICLLFISVLGYLQEITSTTLEGALTGLKTEYLGAAFLSQFFLLFIMDLCDVKIKKQLVALLLIVPFITVILVWTSEYHQYYYAEILFSTEHGINQIAFESGIWRSLHFLFATLCILASCAVAGRYYLRLKRNMRRHALLLLLAPLLQVVPHIAYFTGVSIYGIYYPVFFLIISVAILFSYLMRYNVYDVASMTPDLALDFMTDAFLLFDREMRFQMSNQTAVKLLPQLAAIKKGHPIEKIQAWPRELLSLESFGEKGRSDEFELNIEGFRHFFYADVNRIAGDGGQPLGWVILVRDITDIREMLENMEKIAFTDRLTGLLTYDKFIELSEREFSKNPLSKDNELSIIIVGMDNFKKINDAYGNIAGDELLRLIGKSLKDILGQYPLFARYSGIHFILLAGIGLDQAAELAGRIKNEIAYKAYDVNGHIIKCTSSVGVASKTPGAGSLDKLVQNAYDALNRAQANGYNRIECH